MSGGHYDYGYFKLEMLADEIEKEFINDLKYKSDWDGDKKEYDRLNDATDEQRKLILNEAESLIADLRNCSKRAKEIEWYLSGDTGANTYLERLKKIV